MKFPTNITYRVSLEGVHRLSCLKSISKVALHALAQLQVGLNDDKNDTIANDVKISVVE